MINYLALKNRCYPVKTIALDLFAPLRLHGMKQWTRSWTSTMGFVQKL